MPLTPVQSSSGLNVISTGPAITASVSASSYPATAGNTILVWVFVSPSGVLAAEDFPSVADSLGNSYTQVFFNAAGLYDGSAIGLYYATGAFTGANVVTFAYTTGNNIYYADTYVNCILVAEYPLPSITIQDHDQVQIYGSAGNVPSVLTITDSHSAVVSVTIKGPGPSGYDGIGTINTAAGLVDIVSGGSDYLIAASLANPPSVPLEDPTTSPGGYQIFAREMLISDPGTTGYTAYLWDGGVGGTTTAGQRGNIDWDQIGIDARHGSAGTLIQYSNGTGTPGNLAKFLPDGSIGDSGSSAGTGGSVTGAPLTVNGPPTTLINSAAVSFDQNVLVNGV